MENKELIKSCKLLIEAYKNGELGQTTMPEDTNPGFRDTERELMLSYFTLPMALNYQRNSYNLWSAALATYKDINTRDVFDIEKVTLMSRENLREKLTKHRLALQPNKHIDTWARISETVFRKWGTFEGLLEGSSSDFLKLKEIVQKEEKGGFPYLSGPKIFNYWSYIINTYCSAKLDNSAQIDIAPDTHITKCSVILGIIDQKEASKISKELLSLRWRNALKGSGINPIDMHAPLWFWSRNGFIFDLDAKS